MDRKSLDRIRSLMGLARRDWSLPADVARIEQERAERKRRWAEDCSKWMRKRRAREAAEIAKSKKALRAAAIKGLKGRYALQKRLWGESPTKHFRPLQEVEASRDQLVALLPVEGWCDLRLLMRLGVHYRYFVSDVAWLVKHGYAIERKGIDASRTSGRLNRVFREWQRTAKPYEGYTPDNKSWRYVYEWQQWALAVQLGLDVDPPKRVLRDPRWALTGRRRVSGKGPNGEKLWIVPSPAQKEAARQAREARAHILRSQKAHKQPKQ